MKARRIITGLNQAGRAVVLSDEVREGERSVPIWSTRPGDLLPYRADQPFGNEGTRLAPGQSAFNLVSFSPADPNAPQGGGAGRNLEHPGLHQTDTIDYIFMVSGELTMPLDDGAEVVLRPGDCVMQGGIYHGWVNRTSEPAVIAVVMVGTARDGTGQ